MDLYHFLKKLKKSRFGKLMRHRSFNVAAAVVVFITTYMLILPAITQTGTTYCGKAEHKHSDDCYTEEKVLICELEESEGHTHTDACLEWTEELVCSREECEGHTHSDSCYETEEHLTCTSEDPEHEHDSSCYTTEKKLVCSKEESEGHTHGESCYEKHSTNACGKEESAGHTHTDDCYKVEKTLSCSKEEHTHTSACFSNPNADKEDESSWGKNLKKVKLSGNWDEDLITIAETQLGYKESSSNYIVDENGKKKGYTRYGSWYGNEYGDWCAMYVSFCLHYTGIPTTESKAITNDSGKKVYMPISAGCQNWIEKLNTKDAPYYYAVNDKNSYKLINDSTGFEPQVGNLIFFNWDKQADADHVGIVVGVERDKNGEITRIKTIEGNSSNKVKYNTYSPNNKKIMGYAVIPTNPKAAASEVAVEIGSEKEVEVAKAEIPSESEGEELKTDDSEVEATETEEDGMIRDTVEYEDYTVSVAFAEGTVIPGGAVLEAELIDDESSSNKVTEFLAEGYTFAEQKMFNIRYAVDGETYPIEGAADVEIAVKNPSGDSGAAEKAVLLQMAGEVSVLKPEIITEVTDEEPAEEDTEETAGAASEENPQETTETEEEEAVKEEENAEATTTYYRYSQEALTQVALVTGVSQQHSLSYEGSDYAINVSYTDEANFPDDVELAVTEILGEELQQKCDELAEMKETKDIQYVRIFDIAFMADGNELEPAVPVQVQITRKDLVDLTENMEPGIVHFGEEEPEVIDVALTTDEDGTATFEFEGATFSVYASYVSDPFKETETSTRPATIATVDTKALGITINMFDYWGTIENHIGVSDNNTDTIDKNWTNGSSDYVFAGINARHTRETTLLERLQSYLYFSTSGTTFQGDNENLPELTTSINAFTGANDGYSGKARQGIVDSTLTDGYPTLATSGSNHESLAYLFKPNNGRANKTDYLDLNHLFKDIGNGYISYSSDNNYARLDTTSGNFKVYSETFNNSDGSKIGFFPFNDYNKNKTHVKNPEDETNYYNHHFGLTLTADFVVPTGKRIDDEDIIFYFSGDDDMWLYVDDVLVLDIGGIHEPCDGEINFTTGEVTIGKLLNTGVVAASPGAATTIGANSTLSKIFTDAGKTWDTSADTVHTIKIFYMERGGCYSNLTMTMNLPIYAEVPVAVTKALEGTLKEEAAENDFTFQIMVEKESGTGVYEPYTGTLEVTGGSSNRTITADSNTGYFTIKGGETATTTSKFITTKKFYVNEVGIDGSTYEMVKADGVEHTLIEPSEISDDPLSEARAADLTDITDSAVVFDPEAHLFKVSSNVADLYVMNKSEITNVIREERTKLTVNKVWYDGNEKHEGDIVKFKIYQKDVNNPSAEEVLLEYGTDKKTEFELSQSNEWSMTFDELIKKTLDHEYSYRVVEISSKEGYTVSYGDPVTDDEGNTSITIVNGPKVNITVQKKWYRSDGVTEWPGEISNPGIEVQLYASYHKAASNNAVTVTFITSGRNFANAQITTYKVGSGGYVTFSGSRWYNDYIRGASVTSGTAGNVTSENNVYTIRNIQSDITVTVTMNDMWENHLENLRNRFNVSGTEPTIIAEENGDKPIGEPVTLNKANQWKYEWGILETPASENGYTYTYYVEEVTTSTAYDVTYRNNDMKATDEDLTVGTVGKDGKVLVKNILHDYELPETGGIGTTKYTMGGILLMLLSLVLYGFSLRRRRERRVR